MKAYVNPDLCNGTGLCVETCPEVFELNDEGLSTVKVSRVPAGDQQSCKESADNCPAGAISIEE
jgi:ferredoxin